MRNQTPIKLLKWQRSKRNLRRTVFICASLLLLVALLSAPQNGYQRSVKDFGAIGDGTADDRAAIQVTIDDVELAEQYHWSFQSQPALSQRHD